MHQNSKFVIYGNGNDWCRIVHNDLISDNNVKFINKTLPYMKSKLLYAMCKIHYSNKINSIIKIPFKSIWYQNFSNQNFIGETNEIYFLFYDRNVLCFDSKFHKYLKKKYPEAKLIYLFTTLTQFSGAAEHSYIQKLKSEYDLIITFDKTDAAQNGFQYYPGMYSKIDLEITDDVLESDVFYIGNCKERLYLLLNVFEKLRENGFVCDFHIVGVREDQKKYADEIIYNKRISYVEVIKRIQRTKCILEVLQNEQKSYTLRTNEAIFYNKKLLTNNESVLNEPFYNREYISVFANVNELDIDFLRSIKDVNFNYADKMSPKRYLDFIKNYFKENTNIKK